VLLIAIMFYLFKMQSLFSNFIIFIYIGVYKYCQSVVMVGCLAIYSVL
jgi:hypothetical protein